MYQRLIFGPVDNPENERLADLSGRELAVIAPVIALCVVMGLFPAPFLSRIEPSVDRILARVAPATRVATAPEVAR
jgi:NADH-quinone oxidoreductase subunit M